MLILILKYLYLYTTGLKIIDGWSDHLDKLKATKLSLI